MKISKSNSVIAFIILVFVVIFSNNITLKKEK